MSETRPTASVDAALANALRLFARDRKQAAEQARQILNAVPGEPGARLILGMAHNALGETAEALAVLEQLALEQPGASRVQMELGLALAAAARRAEAIDTLERAAKLQLTLVRVRLSAAFFLIRNALLRRRRPHRQRHVAQVDMAGGNRVEIVDAVAPGFGGVDKGLAVGAQELQRCALRLGHFAGKGN